MESLEMTQYFSGIYSGKRVLVTGHLGFKGSWMWLWLERLGAVSQGLSLAPDYLPSHFSLLNPGADEAEKDVRDLSKVNNTIDEFSPEIIFHFAAQPLVRHSYEEPADTFSTNIQGTVNILDAAVKCPSTKAVIIVTTDKCYKNKEWLWGYRENDTLGGYDPYSVSKACAEMVTTCYREAIATDSPLIATCRAGNVIGGGDWSDDRLFPDIVKATVKGKQVVIRNPRSIRPWQHVLDPLSGYLLLGQRLLEGSKPYATAWNFGPTSQTTLSVKDATLKAKETWNSITCKYGVEGDSRHETGTLVLDCSKASQKLEWKPVWDIDDSISRTVDWYRQYCENDIVASVSQLEDYISDAKKANLIWTRC